MRKNMPIIPREEYGARWKMVQKMMKEKNLDLFFAYSDDHATFGPAYTRWLGNFPTHFESAAVMMTIDKDPALLTGPESVGYALDIGFFEDIYILEEFTHPNEDFLYSEIISLREAVSKNMDLAAVKRIGIAGMDIMGSESYLKFKEAFPEAEWIDIDYDTAVLRARKTEAEKAVMKYAYELAHRGMLAAIDNIEAGVSERAVAAEVEYVMRKAGSEGVGIDTMIASGLKSTNIISRTTFRKIQENDLVHVTIAPRYEGYHGAIARPIFVGEPSDDAKYALDAAIRALHATAEALRPGVEGREVEAIGREVMNKAGLGEYFMYSGIHSIGVMEFEPPIFGPTQPDILEEDMFVSIDIPVFGPKWGGFRLEDGFLITANGYERLSNIDYLIIK